jgi:hypothetical protein
MQSLLYFMSVVVLLGRVVPRSATSQFGQRLGFLHTDTVDRAHPAIPRRGRRAPSNEVARFIESLLVLAPASPRRRWSLDRAVAHKPRTRWQNTLHVRGYLRHFPWLLLLLEVVAHADDDRA